MRTGRLYRAESLCKVGVSESEPVVIVPKNAIKHGHSSRLPRGSRGYLRPVLKEFGPVSALTQAGTAVPVEMTMMDGSCNNNLNANRC